MRTATFLVLQFLCLGAFAATAPSRPIMHVTSESYSETILSRSSLVQTTVITMRVYGKLSPNQRLIPLLTDDPSVRQSILYFHVIPASGPVRSIGWHIEKFDGFTWVFFDGRDVKPGDMIVFDIGVHANQADGYYVGSLMGVNGLDGYRDFSGCVKVADGAPDAWSYNDGVAVTPMRQPGRGFHNGWCFRYKDARDRSKYYLHFFAISSAQSWKDVANWNKVHFDAVAAMPSKDIPVVVKQLGLENEGLSELQKFQRIRDWMRSYFHYSGLDVSAHIPQPFDWTYRRRAGDCKALSLAMIQLLRAAHVPAHVLLLSSHNPWAFGWNSSRLTDLDHVAVYVPDIHQYFDPAAGTERDLAGYQVLDVMTGQVMTVPQVHAKKASVAH